jgi:hypothetical protein
VLEKEEKLGAACDSEKTLLSLLLQVPVNVLAPHRAFCFRDFYSIPGLVCGDGMSWFLQLRDRHHITSFQIPR